jgi:hypothetical protein
MNAEAVHLSNLPDEILSIVFEMALFDSGPSSPLLKAFRTSSSISLYHKAIEIFNKVNIFKGDITIQNSAVKAKICNIRICM